MTKVYLGSHPAEVFEVPGSATKKVYLNPSNSQFLLLESPAKRVVKAAIEEYGHIRMDARWEELQTVASKGRGKIIRALAVDSKRFYHLAHGEVVGLMRAPHFQPALRELHARTLDEQRKFIAPLKPTSLAQMLAVFPDKATDATGFRYLIRTLEEAPDTRAFYESLLANLFGSVAETDYSLGTPKPGFHQPRILEFLGMSVRKGWLLFPYLSDDSGLDETRALLHKDCVSRYLHPAYGPDGFTLLTKAVQPLLGVNSTGDTSLRYVPRLFFCSTYRSIADSSTRLFERCVDLVNPGGLAPHRPRGFARKAYNTLLKLHGAQCPDAPQQPLLTIESQAKSLEEFVSFDEVVADSPQLEEWLPVCANFIKAQKGTPPHIKKKRAAISDLLAFLGTLAVPPVRPELVVRVHMNDHRENTQTLRNFLKNRYSKDACNQKFGTLEEFFGFVADGLRSAHRGTVATAPFFPNPISSKLDRFDVVKRAGSPRKAIASDILEEMREVLIEDDYAWARQASGDYATVVDGDTNELKAVWCPSATLCLYTLLSLPLRGLQARMFDSGEGDAKIFDFATQTMVANPKQLRVEGKLDSSREEGFLQVMGSGLSAEPDIVGIWVPVNKTSDDGYPVPWVSDELLAQFKYQRDWIFRYTRHPGMHGIDEAQGYRDTPEELKFAEKKFFCLFRDPCVDSRVADSLPVSKQKLYKLWGKLCLEVETRINLRAVDQFHRVRLAKIVDGGDPVAVFDLHTLRVSGITDLLNRGVPLQIVSEYVAGHRTYMMTSWYDQPSVSAIRQVLRDAHHRAGDTQGMLPRFTEEEVDRMRPYLLVNEQYKGLYTGFDALEENAGLIQIRQAGICPGTRCEDGGMSEGGKTVPVPAGDRGPSCPQCRFFLTGPAFLLGQAIEGNQLILKIRNKVAALAKLRNMILDVEDAGNPREAALLRGQQDLEERQLTDMLTEWWHRMQFYENSIAQLEDYRRAEAQIRGEKSSNIIVLHQERGPQPNFGFAAATELELKHFISTCTELLPGTVNESLGAHQDIELAMGRFLAMNDEAELTAMFFKLTDSQRLTAANLMVELMNKASASPIKTELLVNGAMSPKALPGLTEDLNKLFSGLTMDRVGSKAKMKVVEE
jgi:Putative phage integrase